MLDLKHRKRSRPSQAYLPGLVPAEQNLPDLSGGTTEERGAIFTRREIVDFILDLVGYKADAELCKTRILEPSFGGGDFLIPVVERLLDSIRSRGYRPTFELLKDAVRGIELHRNSYFETLNRVKELLQDEGASTIDSARLVETWLKNADFLLSDFDLDFTHIVGNPPYVRQELIPADLMREYRRRFNTIYDRADIYIPFIEHSLHLLAEKGLLGFICADRWTKNRYGRHLRELIANDFHLKFYIDQIGTDAFHSDVIAYPAVMVVASDVPDQTYVSSNPKISSEALSNLARSLANPDKAESENILSTRLNGGPWILSSSPVELDLIRRLEAEFPSLEEAGCKVGIGVATGADNVFIAPFDSLDVEDSRKLPLIRTKDIRNGAIEWTGFGVVNPFGEDGRVVSLEEYPRLKEHFLKNEKFVRNRHVSQKNPDSWYRTIDRIYPELVREEKLLIPDIKGEANIVFDEGKYYPHHNLYYITSTTWDLRALRVILLSGIAELFIKTYSTRMHGNALRFQAQYLRRIRIPYWNEIDENTKKTLVELSERSSDTWAEIVGDLYGLTPAERTILSFACR